MDEASVVMIATGFAILITRGSLLVMPDRIRVMYLRSLLEPLILRLAGLVWIGIAAGAVVYVRMDRGVVADNAELLLYVFIGWQVLFKVLLAGPYGGAMKNVWGAISDGLLRVLGLVAIAIAAALIYFGYLWD